MKTWSVETIRRVGEDGGGNPHYPFHLINSAGDEVVWMPTGEVRTSRTRGTFILRTYQGSTSHGGGTCDMELVSEERTGR